MKKNVSFGLITALLASFLLGSSAFAATSSPVTSTDEYAPAKAIINQRTPCQELNSDQLSSIGDYYMEQMMPGLAHKNMEQALGGEGSDSLRQAHIFMARRWYCGDTAGYGMMGMMTGNWSPLITNNSSGLNGRGMMGWNGQSYNTFAPGGWGMMGGNGFTYGMGLVGYLLMFLSFIFIIVGIAALVKYLTKK